MDVSRWNPQGVVEEVDYEEPKNGAGTERDVVREMTLRWTYEIQDGQDVYKCLLVGGLEHEFYVPFHIWDVILPID